ncbi:MAG: FAD-dependent thymidylate synthase [Candidatus Omnitrophota bacterium]
MEVYLAGYNVDASILREMEESSGPRADLTPEVLSAAYARISRDPRPIHEIRKEARSEVEKSRRSNSTIIFKMGHHSVAEHAVFNMDIIGVSRFVMEEVEKFRLCSYTEKSQRYITLDKDFVIPSELKGAHLERKFIDMISRQNKAYFELFEKLKEYIFAKHPDLACDPKQHSLLEGWAKEDARYITALATESQVGQTINARNLELLLRRFASHPLCEVRELGRMLYKKIADVAPSIVIFHEANERDSKTYPALKDMALGMIKSAAKRDNRDSRKDAAKEVELVEFTKDADNIVASSLLHVSSNLPYKECRDIVEAMDKERKENIFKTAWKNMQFYDSMLREFEYVNLTFNVVLSSACFGQLKRHRMTTITAQPYDPRLGVTIPESIKAIGMEGYFRDIIGRTDEVYEAIHKEIPLAAPYILTNSHRKRVLIRLNGRELYHISRLREDSHSQWDIQNIARAMSAQGKSVMPMTCALIGGKDKYKDIYRSVYGENPKVTEAALPTARKIKEG